MKLTSLLTAGALATVMASSTVMAANDVSPEQKVQFEKIIHDYLISNPEVLMEASQVLQQKQALVQQKEARSAIVQNAAQLLTETLAVAGNQKGSVTVVEFFDNQCGHCKKMKPVLAELVKKNADVRVVYKEFPIFGKTSELGSQAAIAAAMQGKYMPMHEALLQLDKPLTKELILSTAKSVGLDVAKLQVDMNSKVVADALAANHKLAEQMHLMGTPAFVVLATPAGVFNANIEPGFIPGAASVEALQALVNKAAGK